MVKLSEKTISVIRDHIVDALYQTYPKEMSTYAIANAIGRDRDLVWGLLKELTKAGYVKEITSDQRGFDLVGKRRKWKLRFDYIQGLKKEQL